MQKHNICSCFGHSEIESTNELKEKLYILFENLITEHNVSIFYFGGLGQFDDLCYEIVSDLKSKFPYIERFFCTPEQRWLRFSKRPKWLKDRDFEQIIYLDLAFDWWYQRIYYRNCEMINQSDFVIFYIKDKNSRSGAYKAMQYAIKKKKQFTNIYELLSF